MGVYVELKVFGEYITEREWSETFDEALYLLKSNNAMGPKSEVVQLKDHPEVERICYSRNIEGDINDPAKHHWHVVGDMNSLLTAESFIMYRNRNRFEPYQQPDEHVDIIREIIKEVENGDVGDYDKIFDAKTQGYPYHYSLLAVGMLLEDRFPKYAVVSGNIDRYQAIKSQEMIKDILKKDVSLPVVTDYERLIDRIKKFRNDVRGIEAFSWIVRDDPRRDGKERYRAIAEKFTENDFDRSIFNQLKDYKSPSQNGSLSIFIDWLNAGFDLKKLAKIACVEKSGPQFEPREFVKALVKSLWLTTEMDKRKQFEIFHKPEGEVERVMSQFGMAMFDLMGCNGRDLQVYLPEDQLFQVLKDIFPDKIEELQDVVTDAKKGLPEYFESANEYLKHLNSDDDHINEKHSLIDGTEFFTLSRENSLSESQKIILLAISSLLNTSEEKIRTNDELNEMLTTQSDINKCRFLLLRLTREYGPQLTEDAWSWIDQENDFSLIKTLCILAMVNEHEQKFYNTKKSIFEKRWLCKLVTNWSKDNEKMNSIRKMAEDALSNCKP